MCKHSGPTGRCVFCFAGIGDTAATDSFRSLRGGGPHELALKRGKISLAGSPSFCVARGMAAHYCRLGLCGNLPPHQPLGTSPESGRVAS
jgi:hypothetical protein